MLIFQMVLLVYDIKITDCLSCNHQITDRQSFKILITTKMYTLH
jgi:hypothetical protein